MNLVIPHSRRLQLLFDSKRFLDDHFASAKGLTAFLSAYQAEGPNEEAIKKWFQRGAVPSEWFPILLAFLELENGHPVRLATYVIGGQKC